MTARDRLLLIPVPRSRLGESLMHDLDAVAFAAGSVILVIAAAVGAVKYVAEVKRLLAVLDQPDEADPLDELDWDFPSA